MRCFRIAILLIGGVVHAHANDGEAFYRQQVYPILKESCFKCHGGEDKLKGEFRVTSRAGLLRGGEYGPGYDEADPKQSIFLKMVHYESDEYEMPPKAKLADEKLAILDRWIAMGAPYDPALEIKGDESEAHKGFTISQEDRDWWAYRPIAETQPPTTKRDGWVNNEIDQFVLSKLEENSLEPNPVASAATLIRRVSYDVTGLPPTPEEVDAFVKESASDADAAYSKLVDRLLASPRFGEKWGRHWLDLVRYAESNGFERDNPKPEIWKYRDWVIKAMNDNMPYDQFVIEQLAGDEIENPTRDSLVATGFHRLMQWDDEPADRKQHVYDILADNVQVTTETFLASTLGCARCHDHKIDPFSAKDYFSFMSYFHGVTPYQTPGTIYNWADASNVSEFEAEKVEKISALNRESANVEKRIREYLKAQSIISDDKVTATHFIRDGRLSDPSIWLYTTKKPVAEWKEVGFDASSWKKGPGGFGSKNPPNHATRTKWSTSDIWVRTSFGLDKIPKELVFELYHDEDCEVYLNGVEILKTKSYITNYKRFKLDDQAMQALQTGRNILAIHCRQTVGGQYIDASLRTPGSVERDLKAIVGANGKQKLINQMRDHFDEDLYRQYNGLQQQIISWKKRQAGEPLNVVKESNDHPAKLHVHLRGSAHVLGEAVVPATPAVFGLAGSEPIPSTVEKVAWRGGKSSGRRLALAKWIMGDDNPLTARVKVNRIWQYYFNRGIVPSSSDFGRLGEKPTHPELLDWLAAEFRNSGWDMKAMHRLILHSQTYRMSSQPNDKNYAVDPGNRLFWRNNMRRLTAEELRDSILLVSNKLVEKQGGPWVYPPLPKAVVATASRPDKVWPVSKQSTEHFRRSVYIHVKRSLRHPMMADFDQADTDSACAVRFATTVPNQALMMLNSKFVNDHARLLGERMNQTEGGLEAKIATGLELVTQRKPKPSELAECVQLHQKLVEESGISVAEAMTRIALLAYNLNEFIYID